MSGLGGQGVVTAAHILGAASVREGRNSTVNPFFGAEKRLAPAESYVRIADRRIYERGEVLYPDIIMIFHPHVITLGKCYTMPFFDGLQENGKLIINSDEPLDINKDELEKLQALNARLYYVPATATALRVGETDLSTNIAMMGALLEVTNIVSMESFKEAMIERFAGEKFVASATTAALDDAIKSKYGKIALLMEKNMEVAEEARRMVREYSIGGGGM
jgi:pyruvate ferredoxin oxidoreductase gamma subunit